MHVLTNYICCLFVFNQFMQMKGLKTLISGMSVKKKMFLAVVFRFSSVGGNYLQKCRRSSQFMTRDSGIASNHNRSYLHRRTRNTFQVLWTDSTLNNNIMVTEEKRWKLSPKASVSDKSEFAICKIPVLVSQVSSHFFLLENVLRLEPG